MSIIIAGAVVISIGSAYAILLGRKLAETLFLSVTTTIGVLYCFGLINIKGYLLVGVYFLIILALACVVYVVFRFIKDKSVIKEANLLQGVLLYLLFLTLSIVINNGRYFHHWDEFSHWGTVVKFFYSVDSFATLTAPGVYGIGFPQYFPGTSLFQYFFSRFDHQFVEWHSYVAMNILYFSLIMPFLKNIFDKEKWLKSAVLLIVLFLLPLQSTSFYSSLYVDQLLGAFFGFTLVYYYTYRYEKSLFGVMIVSASAFMSAMTKDTGFLLSLGAIAIIALDIALFRKAEIKAFVSRKTILSRFRNIALLLMPLAATVFVRLTWSLLLIRSNFSATGKWNLPSINDIYSLITRQVEPYQIETARNFLSAVLSRNIEPLSFSAFQYCAYFMLVAIALTIIKKKDFSFKLSLAPPVALLIGAAMYLAGLLILYVFSYSEYEAVRLASYNRYVLTYLFGMTLYLTVLFVVESDRKIITSAKPVISINKCGTMRGVNDMPAEKHSDKSMSRVNGDVLCKFLLYTLLLVFVFSGGRSGLRSISFGLTRYTHSFQERGTTVINRWKPYFENANPYIIVQGDNGGVLSMLAYELVPYHTIANRGGFTIGIERYPQPSVEDDLYTLIVSPDEWEEYVFFNGYEMLYMYKSDQKFIDTYGRFFPYGVTDDMLYSVINDNGNLLLMPMADPAHMTDALSQ